MTTIVVNVNSKQPYDIYIGRPSDGRTMHYGNPFTYKEGTRALINVGSKRSALEAFDQWLDGAFWEDVEPERRQWILDNLHRLCGKRLGCFCAPSACHGDSYVRRLANNFVAPWTVLTDPYGIRAYWQEEARLGSVALERLQAICKQNGWSYSATLEALAPRPEGTP